MTVVAARLYRGYDRRAHLFLAAQEQSLGVRTAFCGLSAHSTALEALPNGGAAMPCELCVRDIPNALLASAAGLVDTWPRDDVHSRERYAIGLRGEREWHRVPARPVLGTYEGRDVAVVECGCIGFLVFGTPPPNYSACQHCTT